MACQSKIYEPDKIYICVCFQCRKLEAELLYYQRQEDGGSIADTSLKVRRHRMSSKLACRNYIV